MFADLRVFLKKVFKKSFQQSNANCLQGNVFHVWDSFFQSYIFYLGSSVSSFCGISSFRNVSGEFSGSSVKAAVSPCHINFQTCSCIPIIITIVIIIIIMKAEGIATLSNKLPNLLESLSRVGKLLTRQSPMSKSFKRISFSSLKICLLSSLTKCLTWVSLVRNSGEFCGLCLFPL